MRPPCEDIRDILVAEGVVPLELLHLTRLPDSPDLLFSVLDQPGMPPMDLIKYYRPKVQVLLRGNRNAYAATYKEALKILIFLHGYGPREVNGTRYIGVWATSDVIQLGYDQSSRPAFSLNFLIHRS